LSDPKSTTLWAQIEGIDDLAELALNLHWSWNHEADWLWERLDAELWQARQSPWLILQTVSRDQLQAALAEPEFRQHLDGLLASSREAYTSPAWFQTAHPDTGLTSVAYFSMEFMLSEALPIYSGGLGNVAGDQMKAASDLGVPVVGVGLLYGQGYFRQDFDADGKQKVLYPVNDPGQMPVRPLRSPNGEWLRLKIKLPGGDIWLRCWQVLVGRSKLYLLDANDFANTAAQRCITSELYGGDAEMRLRQELVLGIGGWRLLRAIGLNPEVCHLNEGHAAFAVFERARSYMADHKCSFELAMNVTRAGNVFTTHTAVTAGFDRFAPELIQKYLSHYAEVELGVSIEQLLALGRKAPEDATEPFNMAFLAVRGSCHVNGVSKLHGEVSREIFQPLFGRWPREQVPIKYVTNGVHTPTWESDAAVELWTAACGKKRWEGADPSGDDIRRLSDEQLWQMRNENRKTLILYLRKRYARQLASQGMDPAEAENIFDDNVMTAGFARRFATYKRSNLLLRDPERLARLLSNASRPVQLVIAGKAHPQDIPGQALIQQWNTFIRRTDVRVHVIFLSDYDMLLAEELVQGIDLWINTPRRPWEACGTSGMKVLVNGGLNLSEIDGWWAEAYAPEVGWAIGDGDQHGNDPAWDAKEADDLYAILEQQIIPEFYDRKPGDKPVKWLSRMRESMARLTPEFSASRTIRDYTETQYLPAAAMYLDRAANDNALGKSLVEWKAKIAENWAAIQFESVTVEQFEGSCEFRVKLVPGGLDESLLRVEVYAPSGLGGGNEVRQMSLCSECSKSTETLSYSLKMMGSRPPSDFTVRVIPYHPKASIPLEADEILWQR
jgi:starch phosphorylase